MTYNCNIEKQDDLFIVHFPDMSNVLTYGESEKEALSMAKEALNGVLASHIDNGYPIPEPKYKGGFEIEVEPRIAFSIALRSARANLTQKEAASALGMSYQQYQRLENPKKTNPTLETLYRLQRFYKRQFLAV